MAGMCVGKAALNALAALPILTLSWALHSTVFQRVPLNQLDSQIRDVGESGGIKLNEPLKFTVGDKSYMVVFNRLEPPEFMPNHGPYYKFLGTIDYETRSFWNNSKSHEREEILHKPSQLYKSFNPATLARY
jgi:hypothetical protein